MAEMVVTILGTKNTDAFLGLLDPLLWGKLAAVS